MGRKRTIALAGLFSLLTSAAVAEPLEARFAACTGRLSALMEHQWILSDPTAEGTRKRRNAMEGLLEAVMGPERGRQVLAIRIEAKYAQSVLLTRATFNDDPDDARWAARRAEAEIATCSALLTGS